MWRYLTPTPIIQMLINNSWVGGLDYTESFLLKQPVLGVQDSWLLKKKNMPLFSECMHGWYISDRIHYSLSCSRNWVQCRGITVPRFLLATEINDQMIMSRELSEICSSLQVLHFLYHHLQPHHHLHQQRRESGKRERLRELEARDGDLAQRRPQHAPLVVLRRLVCSSVLPFWQCCRISLEWMKGSSRSRVISRVEFHEHMLIGGTRSFGAKEEPRLWYDCRVQILQRFMKMIREHIRGTAPVTPYAHRKLLQNLDDFLSNSCAWISEQ